MIQYNIINEENKHVFDIYFKWKELNRLIKQNYTRGVNLHEYITETLCCILNGYTLHAGTGNSEDAITSDGKKVQVKATSNFNKDLTSFGPKSEFDILEFLRLDEEQDLIYCYRLDGKHLESMKLNKKQTFKQIQLAGKRPRLSIINELIIEEKCTPYAKIDMKTGIVTYY